jgi:tetratricopeptide (TPR) repeat protein
MLALAEKAQVLRIEHKIGINACKLLGAAFTIAIGVLVRMREKGLLMVGEALVKLAILNPDPLASNNLAKVMLETGGNLDVALSLAQTARRGLPDSPGVADTLAWIDYQKGAYQSAVGLLQEALKLQEKNKMPDNPDIHYHLGMAYEKTDHPALARQHLEQVLKINPNYRDAVEVKKQLIALKS